MTKKTEVSEKGKELFDFLTAVTADQSMQFFDGLNDTDKKKYKYTISPQIIRYIHNILWVDLLIDK